MTLPGECTRKNLRDHVEWLVRWLRYQWLYLGHPPWNTGRVPPELRDFLRGRPPGRALDLGCGNGTNLLALALAGWQVTGVDFALRPVLEARRRLSSGRHRGEVRLGDVTRMETVAGIYDLVLDIGCYHGLPGSGRISYCRNLSNILAPGGVLLMYAHWNDNAPRVVGIGAGDLVQFSRLLWLEDRQDSQDRFGRQALWLRWRRQESDGAQAG